MTDSLLFWVALGFLAVLAWSPPRQRANAFLLAGLCAAPVHYLASGATDAMTHSTTLDLESRAFDAYRRGDDHAALNVLQDLQKVDPLNATAQYLAGLVALRNGNDGLPMIHEAARRGSGLALSYLIVLDGDCPCRTASGGGTVHPGN